MDSVENINENLKALKALGHSNLLRYARSFEEGPGEDYLNVQEDVYKDMSLDEIFEKASSNWQKADPE